MLGQRILTVIPARAGSKRLIDKNLRKLCGVTLVELAMQSAIAAGLAEYPNVVRVCSDDGRMGPIFGNDWLRQPAEISTSNSDIALVAAHALSQLEASHGCRYDMVITLLPTIPVRPAGLIKSMLLAKSQSGARAALTAVPTVPWVWRVRGKHAYNEWAPGPYVRSQDYEGASLQEINAVQIADRDVVLLEERWALPLALCEMPAWANIDIDNMEDLEEAQKDYPHVAHRRMPEMKMHLVESIGRASYVPVPLVGGVSRKGSNNVESSNEQTWQGSGLEQEAEASN